MTKDTKPCKYWTKERCFEIAMKYETKKDFRDAFPSAYYAAHRNGWLVEYTWFVRPDMTQKWTYEACYEEAKKYKTAGDYQKYNECAYQSAWKKGWLKDYIWFVKQQHDTWTKEEVFDEARKYEIFDDFHKNSVGAYTAAWRNGWLSELTWLKKQSEEHTFEEFSEVVSKYSSIKEFRENEKKLYAYAKSHKWLETDEFNSLTRLSKPNGYWNKERCLEEALKYDSITEFNRNEPSAYGSAWRNGWLKEITSHMKTKIIPEEEYRQNHVIYVYKDEANHYVYVGLTNNIYVRHTSHCDQNKKDTLYQHFEKYGLTIPEPEIIYSDLTPYEAQDKEREVYYQYKDAGWNMINCEKSLGSLGSVKKKWTYIKTYKEAMKYKYPVDFKKNSPGAYAAACRNKWLKDYTWL